MSCADVLNSIKNDGFDINDLDFESLCSQSNEGNLHFNMESRPKENRTSTPRKGKPKFIFHSPPEAPVFRPTLEEFENPLHYINSIKPLAEKCGICKIIPPDGWKSPFVLSMDKLKFTPRIQRINELEARTRIKLNFIDQLTKFYASRGKTVQIPVIEKTPLDLYTLHRRVRELGGVELVTKNRLWNDVATKMGFNGKGSPTSLKSHFEHLLTPFLEVQLENQDKLKNGNNHSYYDENSDSAMQEDTNSSAVKPSCKIKRYDTGKGSISARELQSLKFLGPGPKMAIFDGPVKTMKTRTRGKKIMYEFDPLARYMCKSCSNGDIDEPLVTCLCCEDRYHTSCLFPPLLERPIGPWKCPKCVAIDVCKPLEEFGFAQAEKEYTLTEFKEMADKFKQNYFKMAPKQVSSQVIENEFWRVVTSIEEAVTVEYGADLHVIDHGSAFPLKGKYDPNINITEEIYDKYAESSWNLNNLPVLKGSVLRHISADISGMKIPWMYAGMCFATFCWHNEDHWSYSINYLHLGEPKTWYGVSGNLAEEFEEAMKNAAPELFESQPDILHQLVTIMNPDDIISAGVPVYRTDQQEGEFVITFPRAYHAGFNQGFNFAEACNFAPYDWLAIGRECISHYSSLGRPCVFSHDELVCKMASISDELDGDIAWATIIDGKAMLNAERMRRHIITKQGIYKAVKIKFEELADDERVCAICNTTCFLSGVTCPCDETRLVCLEHVSDLCGCPYSVYIMKYEYQIDEIANMLMILENKTLKFNTWLARVEEALSGVRKPKITLCELTELLIEANDKEFPRNDLIAILHYNVTKCIEASALARAILGAAKNKAEVKPITLLELSIFAREIEQLPCVIMELNSIKQLLIRAKHLQTLAAKSLTFKHIRRAKLQSYVHLMEAVNLDFKELPLLRKKVKERAWIEKADELLGKESKIDSEIIEQHIKDSLNVPFSKLVRLKREALVRLKTNPNEARSEKSSSRFDPNEIINLDPDDESEPEVKEVPTVLSPAQSVTHEIEMGRIWEEKTVRILKGQEILYISELSEHINKGRSFSFSITNLDILTENVKKVQNWKNIVSRYFMKKKCPYTLIQALWPRKFVSRDNYFKTNTIVLLESLIADDDRKFTKVHYKAASSAQIRSLFKLRLDNLAHRANVEHNEVLCMCGRVISGEIVVCDLCSSSYHRSCFRVDENIVKSYIYGFRAKIICSLCTRTNRPSLLEATNLLVAAENIPVKLPEYYALKFLVTKTKKWQKEARSALCSPKIISALSSVLNAMKKKCAAESPVSRSNSLISCSLKNLNKLNVAPIKDANTDSSLIEISRESLLNLKQLMIIGDSYELTATESSQIWVLIDASRSLLLPEDLPEVNTKESVNIKSKLSQVKKLPMKPKQQKLSSLLVTKTRLRKPVQLLGPQPLSVRKKKANRKNTIKKGFAKDNKSGGLNLEEHEPGDPCGAGGECILPIEESVDWVQCDGKCGKWFHMKCVDLTHQEVSADDEFVCLPCLGDFQLSNESPISIPSDVINVTDEADPLS